MGMSLKHLGIWAGVTAVLALFASGPSGNYVPLIIWLLGSGAGYLISLYLHPRRTCWYCNGGRHFGLIFNYANRACTHCGGSGRRLRWGARMLNITTED